MFDAAPMQHRIRYIHEDVDRNGNVRVYYRRSRGWPKWRMTDPVGSAAFMAAYEELNALSLDEQWARKRGTEVRRVTSGSWQALCQDYFASRTFARLDALTQRDRRSALQGTFVEPLKPGSPLTFADLPVDKMTPQHVRVLRDRKEREGKATAANKRVKVIRAVFVWAMEERGSASNPARDVKLIKLRSDGYHSWTPAEVAQFEDRHPIGTKPRLAFGLALLTGMRRSDVVRASDAWLIPPPNGDNRRWIRFDVHKGRNVSPVTVEIPILPDLDELLQATELGPDTWIATAFGKPFSHAGFGNWFRDRCNEADLPHCTIHGLRKAGSARAAENGATTEELMAMYGWRSAGQAAVYTRAANRGKMAGRAMELLSR